MKMDILFGVDGEEDSSHWTNLDKKYDYSILAQGLVLIRKALYFYSSSHFLI